MKHHNGAMTHLAALSVKPLVAAKLAMSAAIAGKSAHMLTNIPRPPAIRCVQKIKAHQRCRLKTGRTLEPNAWHPSMRQAFRRITPPFQYIRTGVQPSPMPPAPCPHRDFRESCGSPSAVAAQGTGNPGRSTSSPSDQSERTQGTRRDTDLAAPHCDAIPGRTRCSRNTRSYTCLSLPNGYIPRDQPMKEEHLLPGAVGRKVERRNIPQW